MKKLLLFILLFPCAVAHAAFAPSAGTTHKGVTVDATTDIYVGTTGAEIYDANLDPYVDALTLTTLASGDIIYFLDATDTLNPKKGDVADLIGIGGSGTIGTVSMFTPDGTTLGDSPLITSGTKLIFPDGTFASNVVSIGFAGDEDVGFARACSGIRLIGGTPSRIFDATEVNMTLDVPLIVNDPVTVASGLLAVLDGELQLGDTGVDRVQLSNSLIGAAAVTLNLPNLNGTLAVDNGLTADVVPKATASAGELVDSNLSEDGDGDMAVAGGSHDGKVSTVGITVHAALAADDTVIDITTSTTELSSNNGTAANRTFTIDTSDMVIAWTYILRWEGANAGELLDTGIYELSADWRPTDGDTLTITWNGTIVSELARSAN